MTRTSIERSFLKPVQVALWVLAFLVVAGLSWLIPPMQSPDENSHITRAYLTTQGHLLLQPFPQDYPQTTDGFTERARLQGGRMGGLIDQGLLEYIDSFMVFAAQPDKRMSEAEKGRLEGLEWLGKERYYFMPGTGYYFPAIYAPQILALALGQALHLSIDHSYRLARGFTLLSCFGLLWLAFAILKPNVLVASILLLPMSMFQLASPSIDGLTTSLGVLAISLFLRAIDRSHPHSFASSCGLGLSVFMLVTSRTHLLPLLALPFFVAWQRQSRRDLFIGCFASIAALAWTVIALRSTTDVRIVRNHSTVELLLQYTQDPSAFFKVVFASLTDHQLITFYGQSFIGILGWLDTRLPAPFYTILCVGLALCGLASVSWSTLKKDWRARLLLAGLSIASISLTFFALLITWTPHPASVVQGVQGRYFVVPFILLAYVASGCDQTLTAARRRREQFILAGFALSSVFMLTATLLGRYH